MELDASEADHQRGELLGPISNWVDHSQKSTTLLCEANKEKTHYFAAL